MTNTHTALCPFAELAIHTQCNAFIETKSRTIPYERMSIVKGDLPKLPFAAQFELTNKDFIDIQGTFHYTENSAANLKLICDDFTQRNIEFYVFSASYHDEETNKYWSEFVIWTPTIPFQINEAA